MATDPVAAVEPATPAAGMSYGARLGVTLFLLSLFILGHWVPLPFVNPEIFAWVKMPRTSSLMMLETTPLFTAFILVEVFALATSPGRRLRAGPAGRAKLNRAALIVGLGLSAVQAFGIASVLANMTTPAGMPAVSLSGPIFRVLLIATLTAVTAALFFLASFLSEYGVGNGFSLLILTQIALSLWQVWAPRFMKETAGFSGSPPIEGVGILLVGVLAALLIRHVRRSEATRTPPFPQSTFPLVLTGLVVNSPFLLPRFFENGQETLPWFAGPVAVLFAVPFFSWPAYHLFSSRGRLEANLSEPEEVLDGLSDTLSRRFLTSTAFLTVGGSAMTAWSWTQPETYVAFLTFLDLLLVTAIAFDLRDQFVFLRRNGATARLVQLDNVHLSYRLVAHLEEEGIDALARGHHHRSLLFFLGPIIKIDVLVPEDQLDDAQAILAELESAREIKVF